MNKGSAKQKQNEKPSTNGKGDINQMNTTPMDDVQMEDFEHVDDPFFNNKSLKENIVNSPDNSKNI